MTPLKPNAILLLRQRLPSHLNEMNTNSSTNQNDNENILMVAFTITHFIKKISDRNTAQNLANYSFTPQPSRLLTNPIYKLTSSKRLNRHKTAVRIDNQSKENMHALYMLTRDLAEFTKLHNTKLYWVRVSGDLTKRLTLKVSHGNLRHGKKANRSAKKTKIK